MGDEDEDQGSAWPRMGKRMRFSGTQDVAQGVQPRVDVDLARAQGMLDGLADSNSNLLMPVEPSTLREDYAPINKEAIDLMAAGSHKRERQLQGAEPLYEGPRLWRTGHGGHQPLHSHKGLTMRPFSRLHDEVGIRFKRHISFTHGVQQAACYSMLCHASFLCTVSKRTAELPSRLVPPSSILSAPWGVLQVKIFAHHAQPSDTELDLLSKAMAAIDAAAKSLWPHAQSHLFGSQVVGVWGTQVNLWGTAWAMRGCNNCTLIRSEQTSDLKRMFPCPLIRLLAWPYLAVILTL